MSATEDIDSLKAECSALKNEQEKIIYAIQKILQVIGASEEKPATPLLPAIVDINQLLRHLNEKRSVSIVIGYNAGEPTITYSFPDTSGEDVRDKMLLFKSILSEIITRAFVESDESGENMMYQ